MEHLYALFSGFGAWNWFFLVVGLFILDTIVPGVHFLWFRVAAVGVGVLALATGIAWQWQLVAFGIFSVVAALGVRRYVHAHVTQCDVPGLNVRGEQYIGRLLVVEQAIGCGRGKVRVGDTLWVCRRPRRPVGASVTVTALGERRWWWNARRADYYLSKELRNGRNGDRSRSHGAVGEGAGLGLRRGSSNDRRTQDGRGKRHRADIRMRARCSCG